MKDLTVMLSACGAQFAPGMVRCLKDNGERNIRVIGIDMHYDKTLENLYDAIYEVPRATDEHYIDRILEICRLEKVDVVLPFMSAELLPLLDRIEDFNQAGVKVAVGDRHSIEITTNKYSSDFLRKNGNAWFQNQRNCLADESPDVSADRTCEILHRVRYSILFHYHYSTR